MRTAMVTIALLAAASVGCGSRYPVMTGADRLLEVGWEKATGLEPVPIGVVTNHTGRLADGRHLVDALLDADLPVAAIFSPEHGFEGTAAEGARVYSGGETYRGVPIHSLYGTTTRPTDEMLEGLGVLLFDIQDVGARFYTYTATMARTMEAAAARGIPFVVLDRPNPVDGVHVEGPVLDPGFASFVGPFPVPIRHGLTIGEYARWMTGEGHIEGDLDLRVVEMEGWHRRMRFPGTGIPWTAPSPNMRTPATAQVYPGACLIEGTTVSEGRGTETPFELIGAPWADADRVLAHLQAMELPGVVFHAAAFTPTTTTASVEVKWEGIGCLGVRIEVTDPDAFDSVLTGVVVVATFRTLYPRDFSWREAHFDRLAGVSWLRERIDDGEDPRSIAARWQEDLAAWRRNAARYHIYR